MLKRYISTSILLSITLLACNATAAGLASQTSDAHAIKVTVTPRAALQAWEFEVSMETHTRNLNDDPAKVAQLIADGRPYAPLAWEGAPPGSHHRKGVLRFPAITPPPRVLELRLRLASDPSPRTFKWLMQ